MSSGLSRLLIENVQPRRGRQGWHGGPTPVGAVRGVSAAQAAWTPARGRKSIWHLALHVAYWKYAVRRRLERACQLPPTAGGARFARTPANWPGLPSLPDEGAWRSDTALLRSEHARLLDVIARVPARRYTERLPGGRGWTVGELILGIAQHDAYHAGQIQLMKRLWAAARGRRPGRRA